MSLKARGPIVFSSTERESGAEGAQGAIGSRSGGGTGGEGGFSPLLGDAEAWREPITFESLMERPDGRLEVTGRGRGASEW